MSDQKQKQSASKYTFDGLTSIQITAYGVGHFINDLTAACWFNYLLFFLTTIVKTSAASTAILIGQVCDGIATPIVGYIVDKHQSRYGKRIPIYIFGLIVIVLSFIPIFNSFKSNSYGLQLLYYSLLPGIFNIGWASLQISHMSLVPALTCSRKRRDVLNNSRNTFTFIANLIVLILGFLVFYFIHNKEFAYKVISYSVIILGIVTSLFFIYHINEKQLIKVCIQKKIQFKAKNQHKIQKQKSIRLSSDNDLQLDQNIQTNRALNKNTTQSTVDGQNTIQEDIIANQQKKQTVDISYWLRKPSFYLFGFCYMCVRLNSNIFGTFLPFYLIKVLKLSNSNQNEGVPFVVALVPLIIYFSSSLSSTQLSLLYRKFGRAKTLVFGAVLSDVILSLIYLLTQETKDFIYILAIFIGISQSLILATGINFISDVIGSRSSSGAFVFGIYSFMDKIATGIVIYLIAEMQSFTSSKNESKQEDLMTIRGAVLAIPFICCTMSIIMVMCYKVSEYREQKGQSDSKVFRDEFVHSVTLHQ